MGAPLCSGASAATASASEVRSLQVLTETHDPSREMYVEKGLVAHERDQKLFTILPV